MPFTGFAAHALGGVDYSIAEPCHLMKGVTR